MNRRLSLLIVASDGGFRNLERLLKTSPATLLFRKVTPAVERTTCMYVCFWRDSPPVGQGLLIHEVSRSHTTTHHSR